jgi:hypothetical protein
MLRPSLTGQNTAWISVELKSGIYVLVFFEGKIIAVQYSSKSNEEQVIRLSQLVENMEYQKDGVPIGAGGYIIEIRNPDDVSRRSIGDNKEPNGEYILDVLFDGYGIRRRTIHQVKPCLQWWEKNPIDYD